MAFSTVNPLVITIDHAAPGAVTATLTRPLKVVDAVGYVTTAAAVATTVQVSGPGGNITNPIVLGNNVDEQVGRPTTLSDANQGIAAGANLTSTLVGAGTACRTTVVLVDNS